MVLRISEVAAQQQSAISKLTHIILKTVLTKRSSYKEHKVNALALGAEEGRDKLR